MYHASFRSTRIRVSCVTANHAASNLTVPCSNEVDEDNLSEDVDQLFELTRIIVLVLAGLIPGLAESNRPSKLHCNMILTKMLTSDSPRRDIRRSCNPHTPGP